MNGRGRLLVEDADKHAVATANVGGELLKQAVILGVAGQVQQVSLDNGEGRQNLSLDIAPNTHDEARGLASRAAQVSAMILMFSNISVTCVQKSCIQSQKLWCHCRECRKGAQVSC